MAQCTEKISQRSSYSKISTTHFLIIKVICVNRSMANEIGCASDIAPLRWSRVGLGILKVRSNLSQVSKCSYMATRETYTGQMVQWVERIRGIGGVSHGKGEER
jgi:hypothetical protein